MNDSFEKKRAQRYLFLRRLYNLADGDTAPYFSFGEIGTQLGWDDATIDTTTNYLQEEGLIKFVTFGTVSITHAGVVQIENAISVPAQQTHYFPAINLIVFSAKGNITINGDVIGHDQNTTNAS